MADKKLSSVSAVSDMNFVYAETASGETVKISKADLASVVETLMQPLVIKGQLSGSFNDAGTGIYYYTSANQNGPGGNYGILLSFYYNGTKLQIAGWAGGDSGLRCRNWYLGGIWSNWRDL